MKKFIARFLILFAITFVSMTVAMIFMTGNLPWYFRPIEWMYCLEFPTVVAPLMAVCSMFDD